MYYLCSAFREMLCKVRLHLGKEQALCTRFALTLSPKIGVWCNGNTADSGPAFPGSSPGTPTRKSQAANTSACDFSFSLKNYVAKLAYIEKNTYLCAQI